MGMRTALLIVLSGCGYGSEQREDPTGDEPSSLLVLQSCVRVAVYYELDLVNDLRTTCFVTAQDISGAAYLDLAEELSECVAASSAYGFRVFDCQHTAVLPVGSSRTHCSWTPVEGCP